VSLVIEQYEQKCFLTQEFCLDDINLICHSLKQQGFTTTDGKPDIAAYTRLTTLFFSWLLSSKNELTESEFITFLDSYQEWSAIIQLGGFESSDHLLGIFSETQINLQKLLASYLPHSKAQITLPPFFSVAPDILLSFFLTQLSAKTFLSEEADNFRKTLLSMELPKLDYDISPAILNKIGNAWMFCSYADIDNKHQVKQQLNCLIQGWLEKTLPTRKNKALIKKNITSKKSVLIVAEFMLANHALFRSYACWIQELKASFDVILLVDENMVDDPAASIFNRVHRLKMPVNYAKTVKIIQEISPDLIFYPSIGMCPWTITLSNMRLANIQAMGLGHPATSMNDKIDYLIVAEGTVNELTQCSEKIIVIPRQQMSFPEAIPDCQIKPIKNNSIFKIAIASSSMKITRKFLLTLKDIQLSCKKRVEFHFFTGEEGITLQKLSVEVQGILNNVFCYPIADYERYMTNLSQCELLLETFPFGGTNSNIDALLLGMPIVCLNGNEPHSLIDKVIIEAAGLPSWLASNSQEDYINAAVKVIDNVKIRKNLQHILSKNKIRDYLSVPGTEIPDNGFATAIEWLINNHETIKLNKKNYWIENDRVKV